MTNPKIDVHGKTGTVRVRPSSHSCSWCGATIHGFDQLQTHKVNGCNQRNRRRERSNWRLQKQVTCRLARSFGLEHTKGSSSFTAGDNIAIASTAIRAATSHVIWTIHPGAAHIFDSIYAESGSYSLAVVAADLARIQGFESHVSYDNQE